MVDNYEEVPSSFRSTIDNEQDLNLVIRIPNQQQLSIKIDIGKDYYLTVLELKERIKNKLQNDQDFFLMAGDVPIPEESLVREEIKEEILDAVYFQDYTLNSKPRAVEVQKEAANLLQALQKTLQTKQKVQSLKQNDSLGGRTETIESQGSQEDETDSEQKGEQGGEQRIDTPRIDTPVPSLYTCEGEVENTQVNKPKKIKFIKSLLVGFLLAIIFGLLTFVFYLSAAPKTSKIFKHGILAGFCFKLVISVIVILVNGPESLIAVACAQLL